MSASELFHANSTKRTVRSRALAGFARLKGHADENFGVRELAPALLKPACWRGFDVCDNRRVRPGITGTFRLRRSRRQQAAAVGRPKDPKR